jgi:hypothetical protein
MSVYLLELAHALADRGHEIDIFTRGLTSVNAPLVDYDDNIRIIQLQVPGTELLALSSGRRPPQALLGMPAPDNLSHHGQV